MSLPVRLGIPREIAGLVDDIMTPAFATTIGLLQYGAKQSVPQENLTSLAKKMKLPSAGFLGKFVNTIRDLLP